MKYKDLLPSEPAWLNHNVILLGRTGSHAYGTATETSDLDIKGIVIPPKDYFLGLNSFDGYDKSGGKNYKNSSDDIDVTLIHVSKFIRDCMIGVPNNLELLFLDESDYLYLSPYGKVLVNNRHMFLSKQIMKKFGGYAKSQAMKMQNLKSNGAARMGLVEKYGYDTKYGMHTIRLLQMAIEILETCTFTTHRPNADELITIRNGSHTLDQILEYINELDSKLSLAYEGTILAEEPNFDEINQWTVDFIESYLYKK